jgi:hypothetical protein
MTPSRIAGTASSRNSHCQPRRPYRPSVCSNAAEIGEPIKLDTGIATMKMAIMRARYLAGNQYVK